MKWSVNRGNWFQGWSDCHQPPLSRTAIPSSSSFSLLPFLLLLPPPSLPPSSSLSNSLWQRSAEAVRGHQKGGQTQREMPSSYKNETRSGSIQFTPLAQHLSTSIQRHQLRGASESAARQGLSVCGWSQLAVIHRLGLFYTGIAFERVGCNSKLV